LAFLKINKNERPELPEILTPAKELKGSACFSPSRLTAF
jgi:hypothetical protein